ncbi:hypothetical protein SAMN05444172_6032 [Burkholderia sp. GAS332]|nr:hypothetical protein SAMN05444172_6032 [Burkholderia sp. GAS332]
MKPTGIHMRMAGHPFWTRRRECSRIDFGAVAVKEGRRVYVCFRPCASLL